MWEDGYRCISQILKALLLAKVATKGTQGIYCLLLLDVHAPAESSQRATLPAKFKIFISLTIVKYYKSPIFL